MNLRRVKAVAYKEYIHITRDIRSLMLGIVIPLILLFLFGYALSTDVNNISIDIIDHSNTEKSRNLIDLFQGSEYFNIKNISFTENDLETQLMENKIYSALIIPEDFSENLLKNKNSSVQLIIDGSDSNTSGIALSYATAIIQNFNSKIILNNSSFKTPLNTDIRVWFNPELESKNFIIPGMIAVIMMIIAALITSLCIAREIENGTMEGLRSTPVTASELIAGKLIPYFGLGFFDMIICLITGVFLFNIPVKGSVLLLLLSGSLFIIGAVSFGILLSIVGKSQLISSQIAMITTFLPAFLLSGFVFDIKNMPVFIQYLTRIISARYFVTLIKGIMLKGIGLNFLWPEIIFLLIFSIVVLKIAHIKLQSYIEQGE